MLFIAKHVIVLAAILLAAAGAGTLAVGERIELALRTALGLALWAHALFALALIGQLRVMPIIAMLVIAIGGGAMRQLVILRRVNAEGPTSHVANGSFASLRGCEEIGLRRFACHPERSEGSPSSIVARDPSPSPRLRMTAPWKSSQPLRMTDVALFAMAAVALALAFALALRPPLAFDETLYHLPFVRALAESGQLRVLPELRFPVFPQLQELLCVPPFLLAGDTATHLVALAEVIVIAALLLAWTGNGLAAALFAGSPLLVYLGTITYTDAALALFVAAGFFCIHKREPALAGLFLGTACGVKYLGGFFAVAGLIVVLAERRGAIRYVLCCFAAAIPTTLWLVAKTGNPVFPFFVRSEWHLPLSAAHGQPPISPFIAIAALIAVVKSRRVALIVAAYLAIFAFLPHDVRYLVPLFPLVAVEVPLRGRVLTAIAIAPAIAYAAFVLVARDSSVAVRIPEYAALQRADDTVYVAGGEQLRYYARARFLGDFNGPYAYGRVLSNDNASLVANLRRIGARYFLVSKRRCPPRRNDGSMQLVYEDAAAQLWRIPSRR